ncbi:DUF3592 domain-containing protein [Amycolatopsis sp. EV170708-02-1]|uniref:DUF3592 domain-containing protein n=1 Tax=Amycolatopsis sp. EV170708-02-1 TaxID=2919322 RepID=UPI001F0C6898|nr:DUF3592 domain-containing protein [Amycolatopsis sp. EV170708-02-1]UMP00230.1 DUF3592 domain-containing protein [Amycolatopsis sp. EV170708-02-1]
MKLGAVPETPTIGVADPAAETPRLKRLALRSAVLAPMFLLVFVAGIFIVVSPWTRSAALLETGNRVNGTVVDIPDRGHMRVEYWVRTERREVLVHKHHDHEYEPYGSVMVFYDPANPGRMRLENETNAEPFGKAGVFPLAIGFVGAVCSGLSAAGWRRRYHLVRASGWRPAVATVKRDRSGDRRHPLVIHLVSEDGTESVAWATAWCARSPFRYRNWGATPVQVGGEGGDLVVLFPRGMMSGKPYPIPARTEPIGEATRTASA